MAIENQSFSVMEHVSLKPYNSFGFDYQARYFCCIDSLDQLSQALMWATQNHLPVIVLGEGSNLLLQGDVSGLVLINRLTGLSVDYDEDGAPLLICGAGENWHGCVSYAVNQSLFGIENLALIPGTAGAAPVQNIGAYGVELKDRLRSVQVMDRQTLQLKWLDSDECGFGYRDSYFKHQWRDRYVITAISLRLSKEPIIESRYRALEGVLPSDPKPMDIFEAVCQVRRSKLPDPAELGNAGSFFKNPVIGVKQYETLLERFPDLVAYPVGEDWKLAAGWLIEQAGWKGVRQEGVGVYEKQALVLVNFSTAKADALQHLEQNIMDDIERKFGVLLEREPVLLGGTTA